MNCAGNCWPATLGIGQGVGCIVALLRIAAEIAQHGTGLHRGQLVSLSFAPKIKHWAAGPCSRALISR